METRAAIRDSVILRYKCPVKGGYIQEHKVSDKEDAFKDGKVIFFCELCQNDHSFKIKGWLT